MRDRVGLPAKGLAISSVVFIPYTRCSNDLNAFLSYLNMRKVNYNSNMLFLISLIAKRLHDLLGKKGSGPLQVAQSRAADLPQLDLRLEVGQLNNGDLVLMRAMG